MAEDSSKDLLDYKFDSKNYIKPQYNAYSVNSSELTGRRKEECKNILPDISQTIEPSKPHIVGEDMVELAYDLKKYKELNRPSIINPETATFSDLEDWLRYEDRKADNTIKHTRNYLEKMELHQHVPINLRQPDPEQIRIHFIYRERIEKVSPNVIHNNLKAIRLYLRACGLDPKSIRYKPPAPPETTDIKVPKPELVNKLIYHHYSKDPYTNALIQYQLSHNFIVGWRVPSEPCILKVRDVDCEGGYVTITEPKKRNRKRPIIPEDNILNGKRYKSFKNWIDYWRPKVANQYSDDFFYLRPDGKPFTNDTLRMFLYRNVHPVWNCYRPYISRHWCAVARLLQWDLKAIRVKDWLGHTKIETTMTYLRTAQMFYDRKEKDWLNRALRKRKTFEVSSAHPTQKMKSGINQTFGSTSQVYLNSLHKGCTDLAGFEPAICSLGDCRPIQARLQAQRRNTCERSILGLFLKVDSHIF